MVLDDQVWLITGSSGIGAATARLAAVSGAKVFVCGLDENDNRQLAAECGGGYHTGDLSITAQAETAVAGASGRKYGDGPHHLISDEGWARTFDINLKTMFLMSRAVLRRMMARERGAILNMATVTAYSPEPKNFATHAYAAAKGAAIAMTRSAAAYYAPHGIRISAIAPGLVRTPMSLRAQTDERILELMKTKQPLSGSLLDPDDIARAAVFLLGPSAQMITGQVLGVDGGWDVS